MAQRRRWKLSTEQRSDLWRRLITHQSDEKTQPAVFAVAAVDCALGALR